MDDYLSLFFTLIKAYKPNEQALILKALKFSTDCHSGQLRKSGEAYIMHPIAVATILAEVHADADTVAAGLLHDTIEDCPGITKEILASEFNPTIAKLVQGVTNINKSENPDFDREIINTLDTKRLITSITQDVRILVIKLADRLHNMRTMGAQTPEKRVSKSQETLDFYVPLAGYIGEHLNKIEMEDLAFKFIMYKEYTDTSILRVNHSNKIGDEQVETIRRIYDLLLNAKIKFKIEIDEKNLFSLYKKLLKYGTDNIDKIHDFIQIKITCTSAKDCYKAKKIIESNFFNLPEKSKDYIKYPKTNLYKALHSSIIGPDGHYFQCQFRTDEMKAINDYGLTAYFNLAKRNIKAPASVIQDEVEHMQFYKVLTKLIGTPIRPENFSKVLKDEILSERVYVKTPDGATIELPKGSTPVDFAFRIHTDIGNHIQEAYINGELVPLNYELKNGDHVKIEYDLNKPPKADSSSSVRTFYAQNELDETNNKGKRISLSRNNKSIS